MATVYSLIAWGGYYGNSVATSVGTPCTVSWTNPEPYSKHGLHDGSAVVFVENSDTLPTGLSHGVVYYTRSVDSTSWHLYDTKAHALDSGSTTGRINTSGSQSGTHKLKPKELVDLVAQYPDRWGTRIFDGMSSWNSGRGSASAYDAEVCEIAHAWDDYKFWSAGLQISVPSASILITSEINGLRTSAFHNGDCDSGYRLCSNYDYSGALLRLRQYECSIDGFKVESLPGSGISCLLSALGAKVTNMICKAGGSGKCIDLSAYDTYINVIAIGGSVGFFVPYGGYNQRVSHCLATKNIRGFDSGSTGASGFYYNNIAIGNSEYNWRPGVTIEGASNNAGLPGEAWVTGSGIRIEIATSDFVDHVNNDFRPAASFSPQVDSGLSFYGVSSSDINGDERPNYNNGGAEYVDIGAFEFDHGYGPHPATHTLTLNNVVVGSRIHIRDQADTITHYDDIAAASSVVIPITVYSDTRDNWRIKVRKASAAPYYQPWETIMTATAGASSIYVSQIPD